MKERLGRARVPAWKQCLILTRRYSIILGRSPKKLLGMFGFPFLAVVIVVYVAGEELFANYEGTKSALFLMTSAAIWGGMFNSIQEICKERPRLKREYMQGESLIAYMLSKIIVQTVFCLIQSMVLCFAFWCTYLKYDHPLPDEGLTIGNVYIEYFVTLFLLMLTADIMGLAISALLKNADIANAVAPYVLIAQLVFSGVLFSLKDITNFISRFMVSRWSMEALGATSRLNDLPLRIQETIPTVVHEAEEIYESTAEHLLMVWMILLLFSIVMAVLGTLALTSVKREAN